MVLSFKDLLTSKVETVQQTNAALLSFREYAENFTNKLTEWMTTAENEQASDRLTMFLDTQLGKALCYVNPSDYRAALENEQVSLKMRIVGLEQDVIMSGEELLDTIQEQAMDVISQKEFLDYCMETDDVNVTGLLTRVRAKVGDVPTMTLDLLQNNLVDRDPLQSLKNFFSTMDLQTVQEKSLDQDTYITVTNSSGYTGTSVWALIFQKIGSVVKTTLSVIWKEIKSFGNLLGAILKGLWTLVKSLARLIARPLLSRYEKTSSVIGLVDVPLFQINIGSYDKQFDLYTIDHNLWDFDHFSITSNDYIAKGTKQVISTQGGYNYGDLLKYLVKPCIREVDGVKNFAPYDILISGELYDFCFRIGLDEEMKIWIQCYPIISWTSIKNMTDKEVAYRFQSMTSGLISDMASFLPLVYWNKTAQSWSNDAYGLNEYYVKRVLWKQQVLENLPDDNCDLVSALRCFDSTASYPIESTDFKISITRLVWAGIMPYLILNSDCFNDIVEAEGVDRARYLTLSSPAQWTEYPTIPTDDAVWPRENSITFGDYDGYDLFCPYLTTKLTPVSIHYQNLNEAASEVLLTVATVAVAAAAVFATIKFAKFKKTRVAKAEIMQGYVDNMSWNLSNNPSKDQMKDYLKAKKQAKRYGKLNSALGLTSGSSERNSIFDSLSSVKDQILGLTGVTEKDIEGVADVNPINLSDIKKLIKSN